MAKAYEHTNPALAQQLHGALNKPLSDVEAFWGREGYISKSIGRGRKADALKAIEESGGHTAWSQAMDLDRGGRGKHYKNYQRTPQIGTNQYASKQWKQENPGQYY